MTAKRVAIYARVSTSDKGQSPETQLMPLLEYCRQRDFRVQREFVDYASGKSNDRAQYKAMLDGVRKRQYDIVLVWRFDRFARSTQELVNAMQEFQALGVDFISYHENIDTTTPTGKLTFHIMAALAEFESSLISERVKAGMSRAKAQGKAVGRASIGDDVQAQILTLHAQGLSPMKISKQLGVGYGTVFNYLKKIKAEG